VNQVDLVRIDGPSPPWCWQAWVDPVSFCGYPPPGHAGWHQDCIEGGVKPLSETRYSGYNEYLTDDQWFYLLESGAWQRSYPLWKGAHLPPRWWWREMERELKTYQTQQRLP